MELASLDRGRAASLHLLISAAIGIAVVTLMLVVWYPRHYFKAMGGDMLILLLIGVDVVIGPLITLIIFNPKKKELKFDLSVIAALQLAALAYGCYVMFVARPVYNVFVVDRFETVAANQVDEASLAKTTGQFGKLPVTGPRIIGARQPTDPARQSDVVIQAMAGGPDLANLPDLYVPYSDVRAEAAHKAPSSRGADAETTGQCRDDPGVSRRQGQDRGCGGIPADEGAQRRHDGDRRQESGPRRGHRSRVPMVTGAP